ncbi:MAG: hypothetical protein Ct9H300mP23_09780 [Nitrospinota bacterium]|nr:MAG: hypothetical protein Ct9H300mP23_09780 [Nitrospinota bacterium]
MNLANWAILRVAYPKSRASPNTGPNPTNDGKLYLGTPSGEKEPVLKIFGL